MINSKNCEYYQSCYGTSLNPLLSEYLKRKKCHDNKINRIISILVGITIFIAILISRPIFASNSINQINEIKQKDIIYEQIDFEKTIRAKYRNSIISFPIKGVAHIKQLKYINGKPIRINIVEINTSINKNLIIKPQIAGDKLQSKSTVRHIAQKERATIAINGGYFKPQTGVPLGTLMIDKKILTGPIYNRVALGIFEKNNSVNFKIAKLSLDIKATLDNEIIKINNINQPRMLSTYTLLYTKDWGQISPKAPENGYNLVIKNGKVTKISKEEVQIENDCYIIQAPNKIAEKLIKNKNRITIEMNLNNEFKGASHIIGAGPFLVKNSEVFVDIKSQKLQAIGGKNPRSAIGYNNNTLYIVTIDGREKTSVGMTLIELGRLMKNIGCKYAMNFDGGSSSALYVKGKITNNAINKEGIKVSNALTISEDTSMGAQISSL